jgi:hypothetical protein
LAVVLCDCNSAPESERTRDVDALDIGDEPSVSVFSLRIIDNLPRDGRLNPARAWGESEIARIDIGSEIMSAHHILLPNSVFLFATDMKEFPLNGKTWNTKRIAND